MNETVSIITDHEGRKIVLINDVRFKSRRSVVWNEVEKYLKEYIGRFYEIAETSEKVYIGTDFPDEFSHSMDTKELKGAKFGWYRYDTRFGLPVYNENGELLQYNIFSVRMLVRCDEDGKLYLYDFVRTKKETSKPLE